MGETELMTSEEGAFVERLGARFPAVRALLDDHVAVYDELLPHVLLGEVTAWLEEQPLEDAAIVVAHLEHEYLARPQVQEIIAVSFLEHLDERLGPLLGPALRAERARLQGGPG